MKLPLQALLFAGVLGLPACGDDGTASPVGHYTLDHDEFLPDAIHAMQEHGRIPDGAEDLARQMLGQIGFELELQDQGAFVARMSVPTPAGTHRASYTGIWIRTGNLITLEQTHEDGREKSDTLSGSFTRSALYLDHLEEGMTLRYVLRRTSIPAAPR